MGTCLIHQQFYNETVGGFCPYCGIPNSKDIEIISPTSTVTSRCTLCGSLKNNNICANKACSSHYNQGEDNGDQDPIHSD